MGKAGSLPSGALCCRRRHQYHMLPSDCLSAGAPFRRATYRRPRSGGCVAAGRRRLSPVPAPAFSPFRAHRVAGWRAGQVTVKEPDHGSTPPPNIPDVDISPVRLKADVPGGRPSPSHSSPACTRASQWFAMAFGSNRLPALFYGVDLAPPTQGTHARFRPLTPHVAQGPFTLPACYHRRHCYYDPMCQSRAHPRISRCRRLYRRPHERETFPALTIHPSDVAVTRTPESRLRACPQLLPQPRWPSSA